MNKSKIIVAMMLVCIIATTSIAFVACNPKNNTKESVLMVGTTTVVDSLNRLDAAAALRATTSTKLHRSYLRFRQ